MKRRDGYPFFVYVEVLYVTVCAETVVFPYPGRCVPAPGERLLLLCMAATEELKPHFFGPHNWLFPVPLCDIVADVTVLFM